MILHSEIKKLHPVKQIPHPVMVIYFVIDLYKYIRLGTYWVGST